MTTKLGNHNYGINIDRFKYFRISLFPLGFAISRDPGFGTVLELSIWKLKIFIGSKWNERY